MQYRTSHISLRRTVLLAADAICLLGSMVAAPFVYYSAFDGPEPLILLEQHGGSLGIAVVVFLLVFYAGGMYERQSLARRGASFSLPFATTGIGFIILILLSFLEFEFKFGRIVLSTAALLIFASTALIRYGYRLALSRGLLSRKALVVGDGHEVADVVRLVRSTHDSGIGIMGVVSGQRMMPGTFIEGVPVLGMMDKLPELVDVLGAETLIVATDLSREPAVLRILRPLRCSGTEVIDYVSLHEVLAQEIPLDHINEEWLMNAAMNSSVIHIRKLKRILDFTIALIGLILAFPLWILATIAVRCTSPGPILYRQKRCGLSGNVFTLLKFRTMGVDAETATGAVWAGKNDTRVTRVGKWLRKWRIDEIPQLINVLQGQMSLVGPRPERPEFVDTLSDVIPYYRERLLVPPGVTGWAQVKFPYAASIDAARRKLQFDLYYIKHMGVGLDLMILLRTVKTVLIGIAHSDAIASPSAISSTPPLPAEVSEPPANTGTA